MTPEEYRKEMFFANAVLESIDHVEFPMFYEEEKEVVKKALEMYKDYLESEVRR